MIGVLLIEGAFSYVVYPLATGWLVGPAARIIDRGVVKASQALGFGYGW